MCDHDRLVRITGAELQGGQGGPRPTLGFWIRPHIIGKSEMGWRKRTQKQPTHAHDDRSHPCGPASRASPFP